VVLSREVSGLYKHNVLAAICRYSSCIGELADHTTLLRIESESLLVDEVINFDIRISPDILSYVIENLAPGGSSDKSSPDMP
jgi:hypothetical protein